VHTKPDSQIFIDFEGNKDKAPTFLEVLERTGSHMLFYQYILEDTFKVLAPSHNTCNFQTQL